MASQQPRQPIKDGCPSWAEALIFRIAELEVELGNINPDGPWQVSKIADVYHRLDDAEQALHGGLVDQLFAKVSVGLDKDGFAAGEIAHFVNSRIPSGRLPYCNAAEVAEALDR